MSAEATPTFLCTDPGMSSHIHSVFSGGEYAPPCIGFFNEPLILDIGGNVGIFTFWVIKKLAAQNWVSPTIHVYEPSAKNFAELKINCEKLPGVHLHNVGVGVEDGKATLYSGKNNCGECSLFAGSEQNTDKSEEVAIVAASKLPPNATILKVDCEGSEVAVIQGYIGDAGNRPTYVLAELHGESRKNAVENILFNAGYVCVKCTIARPGRAVTMYLHKDRFPEVLHVAYTDD